MGFISQSNTNPTDYLKNLLWMVQARKIVSQPPMIRMRCQFHN